MKQKTNLPIIHKEKAFELAKELGYDLSEWINRWLEVKLYQHGRIPKPTWLDGDLQDPPKKK